MTHPHNPQPHNPQPPAAPPGPAPVPPVTAQPAPEVIRDARGRALVLRKLTVLDQAKLLRAIGPEQTQNVPYVNLVQQAVMVGEIDGKPMPFPVNERMIDFVLSEVGDDGFAVLAARMMAEIQEVQNRAETAMLEGASRPGPLPRSA